MILSFYQFSHVLRQWSMKRHVLLCQRMDKRKMLAVQSLPANFLSRTAVQCIAAQRVPEITHMNTNLMGSSSLKLQCHRGHVVICTCDVKMSNSLLAVWRYRPFNNTVRMSANRSIDCSLHLCHPPVNHCCIPAFHKAVFAQTIKWSGQIDAWQQA